MITSIQIGIRALSPASSGALLCLVDHPLIEARVIDSLIAALRPKEIVLPVFNGHRGHPVLFSAEILDEILSLSPSQGANMVVRRDPSRIREVPVDDPGVLIDIDTPEQFRRVIELGGMGAYSAE
jgi:molybdenum cofactor cytidylyltransferase